MFPAARAVLLSMRASEDFVCAEKLSAAEQIKPDYCRTPAVVSILLTPLPGSVSFDAPPRHYSIIPSVLQKIIKDRARGILIVPDWPSHPWYPILARGLTQRPVLVSARENLLVLPTNPGAKHT